MSTITDKKMLAEHMYVATSRDGLDGDVKAMIADDRSWRYIAKVVNERIDGPLTISYETLRQWYGSTS